MRIAGLAAAWLLAAGLLAAPASAQQPAQGGPRPATVTIQVADWVPSWDTTTGGWGLVAAGRPAGEWAAFGPTRMLAVPPGKYDAYWIQHRNIPPLLLAAGVDVAASGATVTAATGIRLSVADWAKLDATATWMAVRPTERTKGINMTSGGAMLLPLGEYDIYWRMGGDTSWGWISRMTVGPPFGRMGVGVLAEPSGLKVTTIVAGGAGERAGVKEGDVITAVDGKSVVGLDTAAGVAILRGPPSSTSRLTVTRVDAPLSVTRDAEQTVPSLAADSGIRLRLASGQPAGFDAPSGWWGAYPAGSDPASGMPTNRSKNAAQPITLAPATYDIYVRKDDKAMPVLLQKGVVVERGKIAEVTVPR